MSGTQTGPHQDPATKMVHIQNDKLAHCRAVKPDRFAAFASLTMQDPALAVREPDVAM